MPMTLHPCSPLIPSDKAIQSCDLPDKAMALVSGSAQLAGKLSVETRQTIIRHMAVINSYYSNLIEGNNTKPHDIRAAQAGEFSDDPAKRDLQLESLAHIKVQQWIAEQSPTLDMLFSINFIKSIHREFYHNVPKSFLNIKDDAGMVVDKVIPGEWRTRAVEVGRHVPPEAESVEGMMSEFCSTYHPEKFKGDRKVIAAMCAHHRFAWIHPFVDGNGRVGRLLTDAILRGIGLESEGVWCLSRGLAKRSTEYKGALARADMVRQGDYDGRGLLSEHALVAFADFMVTTAIDQVGYMDSLLKLDSMQKRITAYIRDRNNGFVDGYGKIKESAGTVLYNAYIMGKLERSHAKELTGEKDTTAKRILAQLRDDGLLSETSHRSELYWEIPEHVERWYFPSLIN